MRTNGKIQLYPLLRIALFMMAGIVVGGMLEGVFFPQQWFLLMSFSLLAVFLLKKYALWQTVSIFLSTFFLGAWLVTLRLSCQRISFPEDSLSYQAVLVSQPVVKGKVFRCDLLVLEQDRDYMIKATILCDTITQKYRSLHLGDGIMAQSQIKNPQSFAKHHHFNYLRWMQAHDYVGTTFIYCDDWQKTVVSLSTLSVWKRAKLKLLMFRQRLIESLKTSDEQSFAVLAAMTLGDKSLLSQQTKDDYSVSGASHVLALSGLHLTIIYGIIIIMLFRVPYKELIALPAVWTYVVFVGMSASVMRAATMLTIYAFVSLLNRDKYSLNALALAVLILLVVNPLSLYDISFQMSFMALLGILIFQSPSHHCLVQLMAVSLAAQIGTAPLVIYYFGRFSVYFFLTNLIVIPVATIILYGMMAALILQLFHLSVLPYLLAIVGILNVVLSWIASLPYASIEPIHMNEVQLLATYVAIGGLYALYRKFSWLIHR